MGFAQFTTVNTEANFILSSKFMDITVSKAQMRTEILPTHLHFVSTKKLEYAASNLKYSISSEEVVSTNCRL